MNDLEEKKVLQVKALKTYFYTDSGTVKAVDGISFDLIKGETLGIVGETGSGKSVMALSILRLIPQPPGKIVSGRILFNGKDLLKVDLKTLQSYRGNRIAMVFQDPMSSLNPVYTIGDQVIEAVAAHQKLSKEKAKKEALRLLETVGIAEASRRMASYPYEFSGGMLQRVMIAMAIANKPDILIADEPTTALDVTVQAQILELLEDIKTKTNSSFILISHDMGIVAKYARRVIVMYAGKPVEFSTVDNIFYKPMHPYTIGLMNSITRLDERKKGRLRSIKGSPPSMIDLPEGCTFKKRCNFQDRDCSGDYPILVEIEKGHFAACYKARDISRDRIRKKNTHG
jgi:oligopeptide/dipeptide ABC transporter ATP-binding protein